MKIILTIEEKALTALIGFLDDEDIPYRINKKKQCVIDVEDMHTMVSFLTEKHICFEIDS